MTDYKHILIILPLTLLLACGPRGNKISSRAANDDIDTTIVLVNYKTVDRATIAKGIRTINKCNPKIIGINALFIETRDATGDSLLAQALRANNNIVLAANGNFDRVHTTGDALMNSNSIFVRSSLADGLVHYGFQDDVVTSHAPYRSVGGNVVWSFPIAIASYYNMELATNYKKNFIGNTYYKIYFHRTLNNFKVLDIDKLDQVTCDALEGKIVLLGYLGPTDEDILNIPSADNEQMYSTVITANIILNLLNNEPIKKEQE